MIFLQFTFVFFFHIGIREKNLTVQHLLQQMSLWSGNVEYVKREKSDSSSDTPPEDLAPVYDGNVTAALHQLQLPSSSADTHPYKAYYDMDGKGP